MFCEYQLFYGDEQAYRRAIRNRKKILKRRRRARERAAAAAAGGGLGVTAADKGQTDKDEFEDFEPEGDYAHAPLSKQSGKSREDRDKEGGTHTQGPGPGR